MANPTHKEAVLDALDELYQEAIDFGYIKVNDRTPLHAVADGAYQRGRTECIRDIENHLAKQAKERRA